jgi:hypothetical protein
MVMALAVRFGGVRADRGFGANAHNMSAVTAKGDTHIGTSLLAGMRVSTALRPISLKRKHKEWPQPGSGSPRQRSAVMAC